jgi:hypothetical protein
MMDSVFIKNLIGALRGGHEVTLKRDGTREDRYWSSREDPGRKPKGKKLRDYQLHNQEAMLGLQDKQSYSEWAKGKD